MYQDRVSTEPESDPGSATQEPPDGSTTEATAATDRPESAADSAAPRDQMHPFREELARAMQAAADRERLRIEASVDADANAHVQKVRTRAAAEAGELKRLAEDDVAGIRSWAKAEIERIRGEADTQMGERHERLEQHLIQHATIIDGEIVRVSEAVEGYRHELDTFFARLAAERDPSEIARLADTVPGPPDFELIRAVARADAVGRLAELEASEEAGAEGEAPAVEAAAESAGGASEGEPELVQVMDPALAARSDEAEAEAEARPPAEAAAAGSSELSESSESSEVAAAAPVAAADMAGTAGEPASAEERTGESPEPVGAAAGSGPATSDSNPAARFIRSLTTWGQSSDHGEHDQPK
jgi:hypothetical protein